VTEVVQPAPGNAPRRQLVPLRSSIGSRLFLYVLGAALVGFGGMSYLFYQALSDRAQGELQSTLSTKAKGIENQLAKTEQAGQGLATAIETLHKDNVTDPNTYKALAFDFFLKRPPLDVGAGFSQTANGIIADTQWLGNYFYLDQKAPDQAGQPLPSPHQDIRFVDLFKQDNYPEQNYYKQAIEAKKPVWLEPYQWYGITMTTQATPIFDKNNKLIGITYFDVNVTAIADQIKGPALRNSGYYAIISKQGNLLAYPPNPQKAKDLATSQDIPELKAIWQRIGQTNSGLLFSDGTYWAYQRIAGTDWLMVASVPRSMVLGPVLLISVGGALGASILLAGVVALFARQFNRRLQPILDECQKLSQPDGESEPLYLEGTDELEILEKTFGHMTMQLRNSFTALEETNEALEKSNRELEQRVAERTAELVRAKEASERERQALQASALRLLQEVDPISRGNLTIRAKVTEDEIGTIADSYNATVENLCKIVRQVQEAANQVVATTSNNKASVQTLSVEASRQSIEIFSALEQVEQMAEAVRAVAVNASQAEAAVQEATQMVTEGDAAMNRTVDGIQSIRATVAETAKKVKHLGESSQRISTVVDLINAFAAQTNMLALNASIEASRAGEYGKGFAVVAEEVRALARQSAEATEEIRKLVVSIQTETNEVVKAMEAGTEQVVMGTKLVDETRQSLNRITATSSQIGQLVEAIAQATITQSQTSETVTRTMQNVAAIANKTSTEAQQVSSSFGQLREVAETLQAEISQFKV
jgi:methyl-accepting chemotaxis protein